MGLVQNLVLLLLVNRKILGIKKANNIRDIGFFYSISAYKA